MHQSVKTLDFIVPLSYEAHAIAQQQQPQTQALYLKALTVYAVEFYLRCLGIAAHYHQSDWCDPWMAKFIDVADLWVEPYGKLECCWVPSDAKTLSISPDAWADRIGYVAVQIDPTLKSARLLGFSPTPASTLSLSELQPLEQLPFHLQQLGQTQLAPVPTPVQPPIVPTTVHLRGWLEGKIASGWQTLEELLGGDRMQASAVRSPEQFEITVRQAKLIDVGMDLGSQRVVLTLAISLNSDTSMNVLVQTYPAAEHRYLPPHLKLSMLGETGEVLQTVCSRDQDNYIQLRHFRGEAGDSFDIQVSIDHISVTESFIL